MSIISKWLIAFLLLFPSAAWAEEVALVTTVKGEVKIGEGIGGKTPLQAFIKLHDGDILQLGDAARLQITYFKSAAQETWMGPGNIVIGAGQSKAAGGRLQPQTQQLSMQFAKQLAKTPTGNSRGNVVTFRTRSIGPSLSVEQVKRAYHEMRANSELNDHNPELYLLSAYFEIKEYDLVRVTLNQLEGRYPDDSEIKILKSLYARAINNAKMAAK